ncbi:DoxX family protein [Hyphomicrobium sp.]|uniref:DoxX family protein n=1 Tax=Hyphomicrobium sp. TaxID=82 RepID=UPI002E2F10FA|nr:DoxX family protein [Hyphomicrobium sp.]HEX2842237.1 DoxX family protein [Hyphomicrobium sp.]
MSSIHDLASLVARLLIAPLFIVFGFEKITGYASSAGYMEAYGLPGILLPIAIAAELGGGLAILFGFFSRWAALALAIFCVVTALVFHTAWSGDGGQGQFINFMKNLALAGGLLLLAANGPGRYAIND